MKNNLINEKIVIALVVRDRFSMFRPCLEALYLHTDQPFRIVAVVGGADEQTLKYLTEFQQKNDDFNAVFIDRLLMQGEARNIALKQFDERFCVVLENDTIVHENWLRPLLDCMHEEGAAVVAPLIYWHRGIHTAGCLFEEKRKHGKVFFNHKILYTNIRRKKIDYPENHCILLDRQRFSKGDIFDDVEPFDVDLGLLLKKNNLSVFFEPRSAATYSAPPKWEMRDIAPYRFRWDPVLWEKRNRLFMKKWNLVYDPKAKIASYQRQQLKLLFARRHPNKFTLGISNKGVKAANFIHSLFYKLKYEKSHTE